MTANDPCKTDGKNILLVEGRNDCHVILALCNKYNIPESFGIDACDSDISVIKKLNALILKSDAPNSIGIVLDADSGGVLPRWNQITHKLALHGYSLPQRCEPKGTIIDGIAGRPRIGVWIMPNNEDGGMLEDFLLTMVESPAISISEECVNSAREKGVASFKDSHISKAIIHTYLAWQDEPGSPLGQAITRQLLYRENDVVLFFVDWLKRLFPLNVS